MRKLIVSAVATLASLGLLVQPTLAYTRAELMAEMYSGGVFSGSYTTTSGNCSDTALSSSYLGFQLLYGDTSTGEITDSYLGFSTGTWHNVHGTFKKKAGKGYFVLKVTGRNSTYGKITYVARVKKNDPHTLHHQRVTLENFLDGDGTCDATASGE